MFFPAPLPFLLTVPSSFSCSSSELSITIKLPNVCLYVSYGQPNGSILEAEKKSIKVKLMNRVEVVVISKVRHHFKQHCINPKELLLLASR